MEKDTAKLLGIGIVVSNFILLIALLVLLFYSITFFWTGFHNLDLAQNMRYLDCEFNINLIDQGTDYSFHTWEEMFINGINKQILGYKFGLIGSFLLGIELILLLLLGLTTFNKKNEKTKIPI